jgi:hypothetical protein
MLRDMTRVAARTLRHARRTLSATLAGIVTAATLAACGGYATPVGPSGIDELTIPTPHPDPADFSTTASNPWFPLRAGTRWRYRQYAATGHRRVVARVLPGHRVVDGVPTTGVAWAAGRGSGEDTILVRWYAVDRAGDVWWFGQRVSRHGLVLDRLAPRSWLAGRRGAQAGLVLSAVPRVGDGYLNASQPRVVARRSSVLSLDGTVSTVDRTYHHVVVTRDLSSLVPAHTVETFYARGLGIVAQQDTLATSVSLALVRVHRG